MRARSGKTVIRGRKRLRKLTKGFVMSRHNLYRQAVVTLIRAGVRASRRKRSSATESEITAECRILSASCSSVWTCSTRNTEPMPPRPS